VSADFAKAMELSTKRPRGYDFLSKDPVWAIDFAPNGTRVGLGDIMTRKRYAATLKAIADKGGDAFYLSTHGSIAEAMIRTLRGTNGTMTIGDLDEYTVSSRRSVDVHYKGYHVHACGTPASGSVVLSALKILEGYNNSGYDESNLSTHRIDEAMRFGYGKVSSEDCRK